MDAPFFIVGSSRSGTTLLRLIVSAHSRISIPPETWFLVPLVESLPVEGALRESQVTQAHQIITEHYRWPDLELDVDWLSRRYDALADPTLRDLADVIFHELTRREGKTRWGDKTPPYVGILPQLARLYPEARFIHLVRDGRDVANSLLATGWRGRFLHQATAEWNSAIDAVRSFRRSAYGERLLDVRYEDLVMDTVATVQRICHFLGEPYEQSMLDISGSIDSKIPQREAHVHKKLSRAPRSSDVQRWRRDMSRRELLVAEAFLADNLRHMDYALALKSLAWTHAPVRIACRTLAPPLEFLHRASSFVRRRIRREVA